MNKKVLILASSARKDGNSELLAKSFFDGVKASGNEVEIIRLFDKEIGFCKGCLACQKTKHCIIQDDAEIIVQKMLQSDVIVFATPVYYYSICGQLKTMLDRANPLYASDYKFRDIYLLATAADSEDAAVEGAVKAVQGWVDCFANAKLVGVVFAGGVNNIGDIKGNDSLQKAYIMGKNI